MTILLDTDVLIECLRGIPAAQVWLASIDTTQFSASSMVAMELIVGCPTKARLELTEQFLTAFNLVLPDTSDFALAYSLLVQLRQKALPSL